MYCGVCGSQIPDGSSFCPNCGSKVEVKVVQQPAPQPIPAPNIPMDPIPAPNIPTDTISVPEITIDTDISVDENKAAQEAAAQEAVARAAAVAQQAAAEAERKAAAERAAAEAEAARIAAAERAAAEEAERKAAAERAAAEAEAARIAEQERAARAAQEAAAQQAAARAAQEAAAQEAAARAAQEAAARAAQERAAQQAAAAAAVQAAQQAAQPIAAPQPAAQPAPAQAQAQPQAGNTAMPQYQMINGHYVLVPKQLQQGGAVYTGSQASTQTAKKPLGVAGGIAAITVILSLLAIGGGIWIYFRNLGNDKFIFYNLLSTISYPLYLLLGACIFMKTKDYDHDFAAPAMAVSYTLIAFPKVMDLIARPTSYLRYIPNSFEKWAVRCVPLLLILGLLMIIGCASAMYPKKLNAANYAQKALSAKALSGINAVVSFAALLSIAYFDLWDDTLKPLIDNFKVVSKTDFWWLTIGTYVFYCLAMILGLCMFIAAGGKFRRSLTQK